MICLKYLLIMIAKYTAVGIAYDKFNVDNARSTEEGTRSVPAL